jgi:hypothetical protein
VIPLDVDLEDLVPSLTLYYHRLSERIEDRMDRIARTEALRARVRAGEGENKVRGRPGCAQRSSATWNTSTHTLSTKNESFRLLDGGRSSGT